VGSIILGVILGPLMDESYRQAVMSTRNNFPAFLFDLVSNPLSLVLTLAVIFMLINQTRLWPWFLNLFKRKNAQRT
jgi:putative tricarboxylic transport membrane protein